MESQEFDAVPAREGRIVSLRLVASTAASLFEPFQIANMAFAKINYVFNSRNLAVNLMHSYAHPFEAAWSDLKMYCSTRNQQEQSAHELVQSEGIA
jgi:hypothetical protein